MLNEIGCTFIRSNARDPPQNGVAERSNRSLVDLARTMLIDSGLRKSLWGESLLFACQVLNATSIHRDTGKSAYEMVFNRRPFFGNFYPFGSPCVFLDQNPQRRKFDAKGRKGRLVGLNDFVLGYRILESGTNRVVVTKHVTFLAPNPFDPRGVIAKTGDDSVNPDPDPNDEIFEDNNDNSVDSQNIDAVSGEEDSPENPASSNEEHPRSAQASQPFDFGRSPKRAADADAASPSKRLTVDSSSLGQGRFRAPAAELSLPRADSPVAAAPEPFAADDSAVQSQNEPAAGQPESSKPKRKKKKSDPAPARKIPLRDRSTLKKTSYYGFNLCQTSSMIASANKRQPRSIADNESIVVPTTFAEAMASPQRKQWQAAMQQEIDDMKKLNVYSLVELPKGHKAIGNRWVYRVKYETPSSSSARKVERFRARLVLQGCFQEANKNYFDVYSPTCRFETIRLVLNTAFQESLLMFHCDVKVAFLNADIDCELYMTQPRGFEQDNSLVCRLNKSIYGARQSPRLFYKKMKGILTKLDLVQSASEPCLFMSKGPDRLLLCLFVDDSIIAGSNMATIESFLSKLEEHLEITYAPLQSFLGLQIEKTPESLFIHQEAYALQVLERFNMLNCKSVATPLDRDIFGEDTTETVDVPFRELCGSLQFLVQGTRPDLSFAVNFISRHLEKPTKKVWAHAMRILRYLRGTSRFGITFKKGTGVSMSYYSDADYASDKSRRSVSGTLVLANEGAVFWQSQLQKSVSLSSCQSELQALALTTQTAIFLSRILGDLGYNSVPCVLCDNQATLSVVSENRYHRRLKHVDVKLAFVNELIEEQQLKVSFVSSSDNCADICTKPSPKVIFQKLRSMIGINEIPKSADSGLQAPQCSADSVS